MKRTRCLALLVVGSLSAGAGGPVAAAQDDDQQISALLQRVGELLRAGDGNGYVALLDESADQVCAADFAALEFAPGVTRAVIKERGREELQGALPGTYRLTVDAFAEFGARGRVATWQIDLRKNDEGRWRVIDQAPLSVVDNLYRLSVNPAKQFNARNFTLRAEDLEMTLAEGSVFVIDTDQGSTGLILLGRGDMRFHPPSDTEKGQVKIFAGAETLESRFETAYVRVGDLKLHGDLAQLTARAVDPRELKRAEQVFRDESGKSFVVELDDLTPDTWSLLPPDGDFLAEVRTRRFGTLTYSRSGVEAEDISVFDREHKRTISVYASADKLAAHGGSYNEDDLSDYDILDHDIDLSVDPERQWIEGQATLRLAIRAPFVNHIHHQAGRSARREVGGQRRIRLAVQFEGEESEHDSRQPARSARCATRRSPWESRIAASSARRHRSRDDRDGTTGTLDAGAAASAESSAVGYAVVTEEAVSVQQPQLLVPAGAEQRLRDGNHTAVSAWFAQLCGLRRVGRRLAHGCRDVAHVAGPQAVPVRRHAAGSLSVLPGEPVHAF